MSGMVMTHRTILMRLTLPARKASFLNMTANWVSSVAGGAQTASIPIWNKKSSSGWAFKKPVDRTRRVKKKGKRKTDQKQLSKTEKRPTENHR